LILDGHGSHVTAQFDQVCMENNIIPICMPSHSSHLLQPLDVGCFSIIKRAYGQLVQSLMVNGVSHIDKLDFLSNYPLARNEAFTSSTIASAFAGAGLVPLCAQRVLDKLNIQLYTPTPPGSRAGDSGSSGFIPCTPQKPIEIQRQTRSIGKLLRKAHQSELDIESALVQIEQLAKSARTSMHDKALYLADLDRLRAFNAKQRKKGAIPSSRIYRSGGCTKEQWEEECRQALNTHTTTAVVDAEPSTAGQYAYQRAPPRCGNCGTVGHKRTNCSV
jgi:hypothetical protein